MLLEVSDTGIGMDEATTSRAFEPFFSTKELGKGTCLGLAMVYGIVEQTGGVVRIKSEVGSGTTISIYLPQAATEEEEVEFGGGWGHDLQGSGQAKADGPPGRDLRGGGLILVVEDQEPVRRGVQKSLESSGYRVLTAEDGVTAFGILEGYQGSIDVLLTDVVMHGMGGAELASRAPMLRPGIAVIYMSGYTDDDAIAPKWVLEPGATFLQKPFTRDELARAVRGRLDRSDGPGGPRVPTS
ncbi:MAG: response regulator [Gemmatimonadota bacterium]